MWLKRVRSEENFRVSYPRGSFPESFIKNKIKLLNLLWDVRDGQVMEEGPNLITNSLTRPSVRVHSSPSPDLQQNNISI